MPIARLNFNTGGNVVNPLSQFGDTLITTGRQYAKDAETKRLQDATLRQQQLQNDRQAARDAQATTLFNEQQDAYNKNKQFRTALSKGLQVTDAMNNSKGILGLANKSAYSPEESKLLNDPYAYSKDGSINDEYLRSQGVGLDVLDSLHKKTAAQMQISNVADKLGANPLRETRAEQAQRVAGDIGGNTKEILATIDSRKAADITSRANKLKSLTAANTGLDNKILKTTTEIAKLGKPSSGSYRSKAYKSGKFNDKTTSLADFSAAKYVKVSPWVLGNLPWSDAADLSTFAKVLDKAKNLTENEKKYILSESIDTTNTGSSVKEAAKNVKTRSAFILEKSKAYNKSYGSKKGYKGKADTAQLTNLLNQYKAQKAANAATMTALGSTTADVRGNHVNALLKGTTANPTADMYYHMPEPKSVPKSKTIANNSQTAFDGLNASKQKDMLLGQFYSLIDKSSKTKEDIRNLTDMAKQLDGRGVKPKSNGSTGGTTITSNNTGLRQILRSIQKQKIASSRQAIIDDKAKKANQKFVDDVYNKYVVNRSPLLGSANSPKTFEYSDYQKFKSLPIAQRDGLFRNLAPIQQQQLRAYLAQDNN